MVFNISHFNRHKNIKKIGFGLIGLALLPLGGCISLLPKPGKPSMVAPMLGEYKGDVFETAAPYSVAVDTPEMPAALSGSSVVALLNDGSYAYIEGLRLASPTPVAIQNIFISTFEKANAFLATTRGNTNVRATYELAIDVSRYEVTMPKWGKAGTARIDASVRIIDVSTRSPIAAKTFSSTVPAIKGKPIQAANALEQATKTLAVDVMKWVRENNAD